ncbi:tale class homeobox transcription factor pknox [Plasmopara halstedii]|uniref:Tale class homeobox transcription factor pknox n=1 Tax=Plasmopara halstedii TaxID=4781 RepID=A0A0P1AW19_PLAHL|nr:tale class homeobox transcription factor pknox [Plasmopara halstedii]CEG44728.1 tale class homeobox transcription factor pknox [Plasmopara halstedii]|eukprot:XP_024581097.1 tale class homeobox transcription factor pknox [Plasmopara halstedii]
MTFPNRTNYVPGQQRRDHKCVATSASSTKCKKPQKRQDKASVSSEILQQDLKSMLAVLSPSQCESEVPQSILSKKDSLVRMKHGRNRLLDDQTFQANEKFQDILKLARYPASSIQSNAIDPLVEVVERMPPNSPSESKKSLSDAETSTSQYMEAVALQSMADVAAQADDPIIKARYEQTAHHLHEWGERRMAQQEQQQKELKQQPTNSEAGANTLPSLTLSLSQISPYAMELAARNNLPKKRSSLSKLSKKLMHDWFEHNLHHPYPTEEEKESLAQEGGITLEQVNNWFINTRGRKWKPMINKLMAEKQAGNCSLYDKMAKKIEEPYHKF